MRLRGSKILTNLPAARASGFRLSVHRFDPPVWERDYIPFALMISFTVKMKNVIDSTSRSDASPNKIIFERHSSFTDLCHLSKWAFRLGLRGGNFTALFPT